MQSSNRLYVYINANSILKYTTVPIGDIMADENDTEYFGVMGDNKNLTDEEKHGILRMTHLVSVDALIDVIHENPDMSKMEGGINFYSKGRKYRLEMILMDKTYLDAKELT